jgi:hypothetical protein
MLEEELIVTLGQILLRNADRTVPGWEYAGWMFETRDGDSSSGTNFAYAGRRQLNIEFDFDDEDALLEAFKRLREVTRVEGDAYWIKCLAVLRSDGDMRLLFEFDDWSRWSITPANVDRAYDILVGEIYPEALGPVQ